MTRKTTGSFATLGVMLALTACGGPSANEGAAGSGTLRIGVSAIPTTLDPGQNLAHTKTRITDLIVGTLTEMDRDGKGVSMGLAESVTPGDERFVVTLKPGLKFSDGSALTATDVAASFGHYLADETNGYDYTFTPIEKVTAVGDLTVHFDLKRPYPSLPFILAYPSSAIVPSEAIESKGSKDLHQGDPLPTAGRFQIESFDSSQITLRANPNYAGKQPSTKTLVFNQITDPAARIAQVQGGQIDFADEISAKVVGRLSGPVEARATPSVIGTHALLMNNRENSVLSDVRIRQAIAVAIDRNQINQVAFAGQSRPSLGMFANYSKYSDSFLPEKPDLGRARELLAGTKCANGCEMRLITPSEREQSSDAATVVQQNLKAIGIKANIDKAELSTISQWRADGNYDLLAGSSMEYGDIPDVFLDWRVGSASNGMGTGYSSSKMDQLLEKVGVTTGAERDAAVKNVNALFEKDLSFAPLVDFVTFSASRIPPDRFDLEPTSFYHVG